MKAQNKQRTALYDVDFFEWTQETAELLKQGRLDHVDLDHLAEEVSDMGKRDRRELRSRTIVLLMHLLKWQLQPELRAGSTWLATIHEQREQLRLVVEDSPSLQNVIEHELPLLYIRAARFALTETGLADQLPVDCPYNAKQILDFDFLP